MGNNVHDIIKMERKKRGIATFYWSREMARLAQSQADYCAKVGRMVHSNRYAFQGGENLCGGKGNFSPRQVVDSWLRSPRHREYILSPRVRKAGAGVAKKNGKMFYAWAFSESPPSYPDCPYYKSKKPLDLRLPSIKFRRQGILRIIIGIFGLWLVILGVHGLYAYFSMWETLWSAATNTADKLFLAIEVPPPLNAWVFWMTNKGFQSWFIPVGVGIGGLVLMSWTGFSGVLSGWLRKLRLW